MKIELMAENIFQWIIIKLGIIPNRTFEISASILHARTIITATKIGVFESLESAALPAKEIAEICCADNNGMVKLLNSLVGSDCLAYRKGRYNLTAASRKWLLKKSPTSLYYYVLFQEIEMRWVNHMETYIKTGQHLDIHKDKEILSKEEWEIYQKAMRAMATLFAPIVAKNIPVRKGATDMLDIGGSHGYYSVEICRRHPYLKSIIMDLPEAVEYAAPILAEEKMGDQITFRIGDALTDDLGTNAFDVVFIGNLVHHFPDDINRLLIKRVAKVMRAGGLLVIYDPIRPKSPNNCDHLFQLIDLEFGMMSASGLWATEEIAEWLMDAGLKPLKRNYYMKKLNFGLHTAVKPG